MAARTPSIHVFLGRPLFLPSPGYLLKFVGINWFVAYLSTDFKFKVCKSVHHHTILINQPTRCNSLSSLLFDVMYNSECFGRPHAHYQELNNCSSSIWFYRWSVVLALLPPRSKSNMSYEPSYRYTLCFFYLSVRPGAGDFTESMTRGIISFHSHPVRFA
jgi:hypothetical protein